VRTVWKYTIDCNVGYGPKNFYLVEAPAGALVIAVGPTNGGGSPMAVDIHAEVETTVRERATLAFVLVETGKPMPDPSFYSSLIYRGTARLLSGAYVIHVYEVVGLRDPAAQ
jgi:hypothetical protein